MIDTNLNNASDLRAASRPRLNKRGKAGAGPPHELTILNCADWVRDGDTYNCFVEGASSDSFL